MSELDVKRDRIFKMYERMCGRKPDMVVQDLLNLLMRDEMRPLVRDLIREHNRIEIVEKARGIVGGRIHLVVEDEISDFARGGRIHRDIIDTPYGTIDESEIIGRWSNEYLESLPKPLNFFFPVADRVTRETFDDPAVQAGLFDVDHG